MSSSGNRNSKALAYLIVTLFTTLGALGYFLYESTQRVQELRSQKKVLMRQLADEVLARQRMKKQLDSIVKEHEFLNQEPAANPDLQNDSTIELTENSEL